jgi:predicted RNA binding protein with dsRBD fold (UPF0201 family)
MKNQNINLFVIELVLTCFALAPQARATCQEGCLTGANTVLGDDALYGNTTGFDNTANGFGALYSNTTGFANTATGDVALYGNTTGNGNTATGTGALGNSSTGNDNTATGFSALENNATGNDNTADGLNALLSNTTGSNNIALGYFAGANLTTGSNNIDIGNVGVAGESKTIRIGTKQTHKATFIAGISGASVPTGVAVVVDANGHLGTTTSSVRFKEAIQPMDKASEAILALKPVTFHYKKEFDPEVIPQFGLVAEDVEKVNPDLVARDADGKAYTVRYEAVNAILLNEFLKEHRKVQDQQASIARLQATVAQQQDEFRAAIAQQRRKMEAVVTSLEDQAAQIQRVSVQMEARKPFPQVVVNEQ